MYVYMPVCTFVWTPRWGMKNIKSRAWKKEIIRVPNEFSYYIKGIILSALYTVFITFNGERTSFFVSFTLFPCYYPYCCVLSTLKLFFSSSTTCLEEKGKHSRDVHWLGRLLWDNWYCIVRMINFEMNCLIEDYWHKNRS